MNMPNALREKLETERRATVRRAYQEYAQLGQDRRANDSKAIHAWVEAFTIARLEA